MNQSPVYVFAKWQVKEGQLNTVLALLADVARQSAEEAGNLFYNVHQSHTDDHQILLYEGYTSDAAVELHRNSSYFQGIVVNQIVPLLAHREVVLASQLRFA